jgi:hypothetical protein
VDTLCERNAGHPEVVKAKKLLGDNKAKIQEIKDRAKEIRYFMSMFKENEKESTVTSDADGKGGWTFSQELFGTKTFYKHRENNTIQIKLEGPIMEDIDPLVLLAVANETDLYSEWVPFLNYAVRLASPGQADQVSHVKMAIPLLNRECVFRGYGANCTDYNEIDENGHIVGDFGKGSILLPIKSITEYVNDENITVPIPEISGWMSKWMYIFEFSVKLDLVSKRKVRSPLACFYKLI